MGEENIEKDDRQDRSDSGAIKPLPRKVLLAKHGVEQPTELSRPGVLVGSVQPMGQLRSKLWLEVRPDPACACIERTSGSNRKRPIRNQRSIGHHLLNQLGLVHHNPLNPSMVKLYR